MDTFGLAHIVHKRHDNGHSLLQLIDQWSIWTKIVFRSNSNWNVDSNLYFCLYFQGKQTFRIAYDIINCSNDPDVIQMVLNLDFWFSFEIILFVPFLYFSYSWVICHIKLNIVIQLSLADYSYLIGHCCLTYVRNFIFTRFDRLLILFVLFQMIAAIATYLIIVLNFDKQPKWKFDRFLEVSFKYFKL